MPVRSSTQSVLRQVQAWAEVQGGRVASLERVAVFGSYGRGTAGVGSDLDLLLIDAAASGSQHERDAVWVWARRVKGAAAGAV